MFIEDADGNSAARAGCRRSISGPETGRIRLKIREVLATTIRQ